MIALGKKELKILRSYSEQKLLYRTLDAEVMVQLRQLLSDRGFFIMEVTHRLKTPDSLKEKLLRKEGKYQDILDITDLCGLRVICYFRTTVDELAAAIREQFIVDEDASVDKGAILQVSQFGYASMHFVCSLRPRDGIDPALNTIRFEIQVRTALQHVWAEIEHDLGYKSEFGVPRTIRRDFSRLAGLLEIADDQFVSLRESTLRYNEDIRSRIRSGRAGDVPVDRFSLQEFMQSSPEIRFLIDRIRTECSCETEQVSPEAYLPQLDFLNIRTLGDLSAMVQSNQEAAFVHLADKLGQLELEMITSTAILRYLCRAEVIRRRLDRDQVLRYVSINTPDPAKAERKAERIRRAMENTRSE